MRFTASVIFLIASFSFSLFAEGNPAPFSADQIEFFEKEIRPVLVESCLDCHTGTKANVGLQLDHREGWLRGSDYRKVVNLENPSESVLIHAVKHTGKMKAPNMPKKGDPLSPEVIAKIEQWISLGLPWPKQVGRKRNQPSRHWSFQPIKEIEIPADAGHPIDYLVGLKHKEKGLSLAPKADRQTLYRRLSYDLTGLPPKYQKSQKFVNQDGGWSKLIDEFLESPHYGERWARHWMDIARYSDTKGYEAGGRERRFIFSYTYRDWLIRAFNDDLPFDQFLLYQLAADKLVKDWAGPDRGHLAAMGFISLSKNGQTELVVDDRLDTTFRGMMGLTVSCARCHDHKFDPVSTKEYYGLYGIFRNSMEPRKPQIEDLPDTPEYKAYLKELAALEKKVSDHLKPHLEAAKKKHPELAGNAAKLKSKVDREILKKNRELQIKVDKFIANQRMEPAKALVVTDRVKPHPQHVYIRGNPSRRGELAPAKFLKLANPVEPAVFTKGSGRLEMAHQIASAGNPMTARVIVNRIWMWHFGEGIVRTVSDFGTQGEKPDNPELLDWLAGWFIDNGWSVKKLHRLILTSETWQQSAENPKAEKFQLIDPENRLLWKSFRRRLDFEQMRDSYLDVAGVLDGKLYGLTEKILEPPFSKRRSVYGFIDRQNLSTVFRHFDFSNPQETTGQRQKTTIPMQALFTMNSPFVMNQAASLAKSSEAGNDRIGYLHQKVFARDPSESDRVMASSFISSFHSGDDGDFRQNLSGWSYGWGGLDKETGKVTFKPFRYWDPKLRSYRIKKEYPIKGSKQSYLAIGKNTQHPGLGPDACSILRWHAPRDMAVSISGKVIRQAVNKGKSGLGVNIVSSRQGVLVSKILKVSELSVDMPLEKLSVKQGEILYFITDSDGDTSYDSNHWDPIVANAGDAGERWKMSFDISQPRQPLTAWEAYTQALLNTNRFLFIQ